jgi:cyanophycin synthetase
MEAARSRDIPWMQAWNVARHWQFGWGSRSEVHLQSGNSEDSIVAARVTRDKRLAKAMLQRMGYPVTKHFLVRDEAELPAAIEAIGFPCVTKPVDQNSGEGISVGLNTIEAVRAGFAFARGVSPGPVMVEEFVPGDDCRLLVVEGKLAGAFRRDPPHATGDGRKSVRELIEDLNRGRVLPGIASLTRCKMVPVNARVAAHLALQGLDFESVPVAGRKISLLGNANTALGASCTDVTDRVHPKVRFAAEMLARTLKLRSVGLDYLTTDISRHWDEVPGAFIELNAIPGLVPPLLAGWSPVKIGNVILGKGIGRIPVDCLVVPDVQFDAVEAELAARGLAEDAGWASHRSAWVGPLRLQVVQGEGWSGIETLLGHQSVARALLVVSAAQLQRRGFPLDRVDRVWNCDADLPQDWAAVLDKTSASPVERGDWRACIEQALPA